MKEVKCQAHTVMEVAAILKESDASFSEASRLKLAEWLEELHHSRNAIDNVRTVLANPQATVILPDDWQKKQTRIGY
jgi:hypothetical protein